MEVSYEHANPEDGHESYILKFTGEFNSESQCILVDSGDNVSVDETLEDDEKLVAILLTHAHGDHYSTLGENVRSDVPILTSPETEEILETTLDETQKYSNVGDSDAVIDSLESVSDWTTVTSRIRVRPVPVGHCPGAVGFVIRFDADGETHNIFCTGDFTFESVAGNSGMPMTLPSEVDALFMNASVTTQEEQSFSSMLNDAVRESITAVKKSGKTLVSASGLSGVHFGVLVGHLIDEIKADYTVTFAGHVAKLYDDLSIEAPNVDSVPKFNDISPLVSEDSICIAGPSIPRNNASGRIFSEIKGETENTLIQLVSGTPYEPVTDADCHTKRFQYKAHPEQRQIDEFVSELLPRELIIEHGRTGVYGDRYNHTITWSNRDTDEYVIYTDGYWKSPRWINDQADESIRANHHQKHSERSVVGNQDTSFPPVEFSNTIDFSAEGLTEKTLSAISEPAKQVRTDTQLDVDENQRSTGSDVDSEKSVSERLAAIEEMVSSETTVATVIDAGDGDILLKLSEEQLPDVSHGDDVIISFEGD